MKKVLSVVLVSAIFPMALLQAKTANMDQIVTFHGGEYHCQALDHITVFARMNSLDPTNVRKAANLMDKGKTNSQIATATGLADSEAKMLRHNLKDVVLHCTPHTKPDA